MTMGEIVVHRAKTPVEYRRKFAASPEVRAMLSPVEDALLMASTETTFAEIGAKELAKEFALSLKWIAKDIGCRIADEELSYIVIRTTEIVKRYYLDMTMREFRLAFEMSLTGELDAFLPKDAAGMPDKKHYGSFNVEYVGKILSAYKSVRLNVLRKINRAKPVEDYIPVASESERRKYKDSARRDCVFAFLHYKYRGTLPPMSPIGEMLCYDNLASVGLADRVEVSADEQREILRATVQDFRMRGLNYDAERISREGDVSVEHRSFVAARRRALRETFDRMILDEVQINDYL